MGSGFANLLGAGDFCGGLAVGNRRHGAGISSLAAHFGVENGLVGDDEERVFLRMDFEDRGRVRVAAS